DEVIGMSAADLRAIEELLKIDTLAGQHQKVAGKDLEITGGEQMPHLHEFSFRIGVVSLRPLAGLQQQATDAAKLPAGIVGDLEEGFLPRVQFGGRDSHRLFFRLDIVVTQLPVVFSQYTLLDEQSDHQPQESQRSKCAFQEGAHVADGQGNEFPPAYIARYIDDGQQQPDDRNDQSVEDAPVHVSIQLILILSAIHSRASDYSLF